MRSAVSFAAVVCLLVLLVPVDQLPSPSPPAGPQAMPPHPSLLEKARRGEIALHLPANLGIDRPTGRPQALTGTINALAVAVDFSDKVKTVTASYFDTLLFADPVSGRGSVNDYYNEVSYGQVDIVTVNMPSSIGWKRAPQTLAYYTNGQYCTDGAYPNNCQKLAEDIVDAVDSVVNFADYDNDGDGYAEPIMLIHSGPGADFTGSVNDIWSHSWSLKNPRSYDGVTIADYVIMPEYWQTVSASTSDMSIGVFVHEMGHGFWNLPDVYDRDDSSEGVGRWSLMASGSWNGPNSGGWGTDGSSPAWPDAWCRSLMGFVTPSNVTSNLSGASIPQAYNNPAPAKTVFRLRSSSLAANEYFLVENRQQGSGTYDEYLPGAGLLIWHVDEAMNVYSKWNNYECTADPHCNCDDNSHFVLALEQADGQHHLESGSNLGDTGDPFPGSTNNRTWDNTTHPESSSWYACGNTCIAVGNIGNSGATMAADLQVSCGGPQENWLFLPLVLKKNGTPIPPVAIPNGDFESGHANWTEFSLQGYLIIVNSDLPSGVTPHSGSWLAWLGGADSEISYIEQQVTVPSGALYLTYYHWIGSEDDCGYDFASVRINGVSVHQYDLCSSTNTGGWLRHAVSLADYAGQSVLLQIRTETDSSYTSSLLVDDVAFSSSAAAPPAAPAAHPSGGRMRK